MANTGLPTAASVVLFMDAYAAWFRRAAALGLGAAGEGATVAASAQLAGTRIMGDGTAAFPGMGNATLQQELAEELRGLALQSRYDIFTAGQARAAVTRLEQHILQNLPPGWSFTGGGTQALDAFLLRANGAAGPTAPSTPVLTAASGGSLPSCSAAGAPRVVVTLVGAADFQESLPSAEAAQVALAGASSAYAFTPAGAVPGGAFKLRVYRGLAGGAPGAYFWDQDVALTPGAAYPQVRIVRPDAALRADVTPPAWLAACALPEFAALYALVYASLSAQSSGQTLLMTLRAAGMLNPVNVLLSRADGYLGYGNPPSSGLFGAWVGGSGYTAGAPASSSLAAQGLQGFCGATALQARVTAPLAAAATLSAIAYTYTDSTHATAQSATLAGPFTLTAAAGDVAVLSGIPAGRLVKSVTGLTAAGSGTGAFVLEGAAPRSL